MSACLVLCLAVCLSKVNPRSFLWMGIYFYLVSTVFELVTFVNCEGLTKYFLALGDIKQVAKYVILILHYHYFERCSGAAFGDKCWL